MKRCTCLILLALALCTGCRNSGNGKGTTTIYKGPTESLAEVVTAINRNNGAIPTLWARHYYEANIVDEKKNSHFVNGDGALLYRQSQEMKLVGTRPVMGTVFEIGSTPTQYWLKIVPEVDTMWWGNYANLGKPCAKQEIPIRPDLVVEVLGIATIHTDLSQLPAPVMRFNNDADAYMFVWVSRLPDRWVAQKEIWYDRASKRPLRVYLFDANGRVVLRALLAKHQPVEVSGVPKEQWPVVPTDYRLLFPDTGTKMSFQLSDMALDKNSVIERRGFLFPQEANVSKVIQIDEGCGD